jgi:hypothetical protein
MVGSLLSAAAAKRRIEQHDLSVDIRMTVQPADVQICR